MPRAAALAAALLVAAPVGAMPLEAHYAAMSPPVERMDWHLHDPSRIVQVHGGGQRVAVTGKAQEDGYACGLETWVRSDPTAAWLPETCLFIEKPAWIADELPDNGGAFWAPDLLDAETMVYSVSAGFEAPGSCVGLARLQDGVWRDAGAPLTCLPPDFQSDAEISAIDPSVFRDDDDRVYLVTGGGLIHATELDPDTLAPLTGDWFTPDHPGWSSLARGPMPDGDDHEWVEAAMLHRHGDAYYLFVNWGGCCAGVASTYSVYVGRSDSPLGPFLDKSGRDLLAGGGTLLLDSDGAQIGPGHAAIWSDASGKDWLSFHYYDAHRDGLPWIGEHAIDWSSGWPEVME
ncbi:MAG: family 43 glycosylhydrolase [Pseudomonadota bacterium]